MISKKFNNLYNFILTYIILSFKNLNLLSNYSILQSSFIKNIISVCLRFRVEIIELLKFHSVQAIDNVTTHSHNTLNKSIILQNHSTMYRQQIYHSNFDIISCLLFSFSLSVDKYKHLCKTLEPLFETLFILQQYAVLLLLGSVGFQLMLHFIIIQFINYVFFQTIYPYISVLYTLLSFQ